MGCVVNGPGEAREADCGVALGRGHGLIFRKGRPLGQAPYEKLPALLEQEARHLLSQTIAETEKVPTDALTQ
jgi:(E)-4-hydroxy-3-methylbut-2-enyl-diphosphate synthase